MSSEGALDLDRTVIEILVPERERRAAAVAWHVGHIDCAGQMLVEPGVGELHRQRQILDRSPGRACADLGDAEVEAAAEGCSRRDVLRCQQHVEGVEQRGVSCAAIGDGGV